MPLRPRQSFGTAGLSVRLPVIEETLRQASFFSATVVGQRLTSMEQALARQVFRQSIDYERVRLIRTGFLEYRTVGNVIRVENGFTISDAYMAKTLIHELTHVWQYQQGGTAYMSASIQAQIGATLTSGSRNFAYEYDIAEHSSFFDFGPEQQGLIVENYFGMVRDQTAPSSQNQFYSNHIDPQGSFKQLARAERMSEITSELPSHELFIRQVQNTRPRSETQIMNNPSEYMMQFPSSSGPTQSDSYIFRPLLRVDF